MNIPYPYHVEHRGDCVDNGENFTSYYGMHLYVTEKYSAGFSGLMFTETGHYSGSGGFPTGTFSIIYDEDGTEKSDVNIGDIYAIALIDSSLALYYCPTAYIFDEDNPGGGGSTPAEAKPDMNTVNIEGATFNSWEEITANTPNLTSEKLQKVNASNDDLLHVNIVGKEDKTVPASAVAAMDKSSIGGLHVFIGESDAVTFLNNIDYSKYTGMNFKHEDEVTENSRTIDFTSKGKLNAVLVFHTLIAPDKKAYVYKVVDGKEVLVCTASSNSNGGFCFAIDELAKYVIKY